jgi:hypothetical protein
MVAATVDEKAGTWTAALRLPPGLSRIEVLVRNPWREARIDLGAVAYRRPPRLRAADEVRAGEKAVADVVLTVLTPLELPPRELRIDGRPTPFTLKRLGDEEGLALWRLTAEQVPVKEGNVWRERLVLGVRNDDGHAPQPLPVRVLHEAVALPPPRVALIQPECDQGSDQPELSLHYQVHSASPLLAVEIWRDGELLSRSDLKGVQKFPDGYELEESRRVRLRPGPNRLRIAAISDGGRAETGVVIGHATPPVLVVVERLELRTEDGVLQQKLPPLRIEPAGPVFAPPPRGLVWLRGLVRWSDPDDPALNDPNLEAVLYVNSARQLPVQLERRGQGDEANVRRFAAPLLLSRAKDNRVEVELFDHGGRDLLKQQQSAFRGLSLDCVQPVKRQRLHVLIVGVDVADAAALKRRVLRALGAKAVPPGLQGGFEAPAFEQATLYHVLAGEVHEGQVALQLVEVRRQIQALQRRSGWANDLVLVYYQGDAPVRDAHGQTWLLTSRNRAYPKAALEGSAIPVNALTTPGVRFLLLNVAQPKAGPDALRGWDADLHVGMARYVCLREADLRSAEPRLLSGLEEAVRRKHLLGEMLDQLAKLLPQDEIRTEPPFLPHGVGDFPIGPGGR